MFFSQGYAGIVIMWVTHHTGVVLKKFVTEMPLATSLVSDDSWVSASMLDVICEALISALAEDNGPGPREKQ